MYEIRTVIVELEHPIDSDDDYLVNGIADEHYGVGRELVRCKDCKHKRIKNKVWTCPFGLPQGCDFWCAMGERETDHD